jgi:hypothetical protein
MKNKKSLHKKVMMILMVILILCFGLIAALRKWSRSHPHGGGECYTEVLKQDDLLGKKGDRLTVCP